MYYAFVSEMYKVTASPVSGRKGGKKGDNDNNLDSLKVNNLMFPFSLPQKHFFSRFLIGEEIITYFSFVFVSRIVSCLPGRASGLCLL